ncbi:MAG: phosphoribosylformylglycinamidine cyclo-ligase [Thermodesulfobacteriota bacterium]
MSKTTYKSSGVDIDAGNKFVKLIKPLVESTSNRYSRTKLGGFSGSFSLPGKYRKPLLVSSTDGVGTKLKLAFDSGVLNTIGIDLVAMSVNDIVTCGAEPIFFLDYLATSRLIPRQHVEIVKGIVKGCKASGCVLLGGETAEMPGFYKKNEFDLAGFAVGVVEEKKFIDGNNVKPGDVLIGLNSSGLHSNGYSLARNVLLKKGMLKLDHKPRGFRKPLYKELLEPTRIYVKAVLDLVNRYNIKSVSHITGGGLLENVPRVIPKNTRAVIDQSLWKLPKIMELIREIGNVEQREMLRTFNCGIGMVLVVSDREKSKVLNRLKKLNQKASVIGEVEKNRAGSSRIEILPG